MLHIQPLIVLMAVCMALPGWAQAPGNTVAGLMEVSGIAIEIDQLALQIRSGVEAAIEARAGEGAPSRAKRALTTFDQTFSPAQLRQSFIDSAKDLLDPEPLKDVIAWHTSAPGKRILELELHLPVSDDPHPSIQARPRDWEQASPERKALLNDIVDISGVVLFAQRLDSISWYVGYLGQQFLKAPPGQRIVDMDELFLSVMGKKTPDQERQILDIARATNAGIYATLSDQDLEAYRDYLRSPSAQAVNKSLRMALGMGVTYRLLAYTQALRAGSEIP